MAHSYMMEAQIERLERLWQDQSTFFPSVKDYRYKFPRSIDYYRYLSDEALTRHIKKLEDIIAELQENEAQITRALDWCYMMTPDSFKNFLKAVPWILTARGVVFSLDYELQSLKAKYSIDKRTREEVIEQLQKQCRCFRQQIRHLKESMEVIEFATSRQPKPVPFTSFYRDGYANGEVVVGFYDDRIQGRWTDPYIVVVADSTIGRYHMAVRPLDEKELENSPIDLPTMPERAWMKRVSYDWVMPMEAYYYYLNHPGLTDEHARVLERSGFEAPTKFEVLVHHFEKQELE